MSGAMAFGGVTDDRRWTRQFPRCGDTDLISLGSVSYEVTGWTCRDCRHQWNVQDV